MVCRARTRCVELKQKLHTTNQRSCGHTLGVPRHTRECGVHGLLLRLRLALQRKTRALLLFLGTMSRSRGGPHTACVPSSGARRYPLMALTYACASSHMMRPEEYQQRVLPEAYKHQTAPSWAAAHGCSRHRQAPYNPWTVHRKHLKANPHSSSRSSSTPFSHCSGRAHLHECRCLCYC